jgi:YidC/Oxa1 family membrane protein insertase
MDRKGIIAISAAILVLLWWTQYYSKQTAAFAEQRRQEQLALAAKNPVTTPAPASLPAGSAPAAAPGAPATASTPAAAAVPETLEKASTPAVDYTFTNLGGGIARASLLQHKVHAGNPIVLNRFGSIPIGAISEGSVDEARLPFTLVSGAGSLEPTYERTDARKLQITKKFTLPRAGHPQDEYVTILDLTFANRGDQPLQLPGYYVHAGSAAPLHADDIPTFTGAGWQRNGKFVFKDSGSFTSGGFLMFGHSDAPIFTETGEIAWGGVTNQYYSNLVTPIGQKGSGIWAHRFDVDHAVIGRSGHSPDGPPPPTASTDGRLLHAVEAAVALPAFSIPAGGSVTQRVQLYTGPREYQRLTALGAGQEGMMNFGMFKVVSKTLLASMNWLRAKLGTYALAIIVLTIIIRGLMWPLQNKATQSMKNIAALQPKMTELKEKYPDDPTRVQQETMKLYKEYNINPLMGCLPMLIQIPIFFGFYNMLGAAVELRNSPFLWVNDLSQPDTVATIAGFPLNVLPLLMAVTMFWQMHISPKTGDIVQQRVFMFMPVIFIIFCYKYASALALYWTVQNLFTIVQLYLTRNQTTPVLQKIATTGKKKRS